MTDEQGRKRGSGRAMSAQVSGAASSPAQMPDATPARAQIQGAAVDYRAQRAYEARRAKRRRAIACVSFVLVAFLCAGAWGGWQVAQQHHDALDAQVATPNVASASSDVASAADVTYHEVVDSAGRSVQVPQTPQSVAVMDSFSGELAVMIGAGPRLCGVPAGVSSDAILQAIYPELATGPATLSGGSVNIESLMSMGCDVALVKSTMSDEERAKLDKVGIPYVVVDYTTVEGQIAAIRLVGQVCGGDADAKAQALAVYYESVVADVAARVEGIADQDRVSVYHAINDVLLTDSSDSLGADWITRTGCVDVSATSAATSGSDYTATLEQIYVWDPDLVICNVATTADAMRADARWEGLRAVEQGCVLNIPIGATRWGQRGSVETYLAMLWLGCQAYPQAFSDVDMRQVVSDYYRDYLGVEITDELYAQIVSGEGIRANGTGGGTGAGSGQGGK